MPFAGGRTLVATGHGHQELRFWDPASSRTVFRTPPNFGSVVAMAAVPHPDGRTVLASGWRAPVVWDDLDNSTARQLPPSENKGIIGAMAAVPLAAGGCLLVASMGWKKAMSASIARWDPLSGKYLGDFIVSGSPVQALAVVADAGGKHLLAAGDDRGHVRIWDPVSGALHTGPFAAGSKRVFALAGTQLPDGSGVLVCAGKAHRILMWNVMGQPVGKPLSGHGAPVRHLATLPDGLVASWGEDRTIRLWDIASGTQVRASVPTGAVAITALAAVAGRRVVTGAADGTVRIWDMQAGVPVSVCSSGHTLPITSVVSVSTAAGDTSVVSSDRSGTLWQWDPDTGSGHRRTTDFGTSPTAVRLPGGGVRMASSSFSVKLWDPATAKLTGEIDIGSPRGSVLVPLSGPEGRPLLAQACRDTGYDGRAFVVDPIAGARYSGPFSVPGDRISQLAAVPGPGGHDLLACGGHRGTVQVWDPVAGSAVGEPLVGHSSLSALTAFRAGGTTVLASAGGRKNGELEDALCLWDVITGACLLSLLLDMPILSLTAWGNRLGVHCDNGVLVLEFDC